MKSNASQNLLFLLKYYYKEGFMTTQHWSEMKKQK